jgi:hypothetical protein
LSVPKSEVTNTTHIPLRLRPRRQKSGEKFFIRC